MNEEKRIENKEGMWQDDPLASEWGFTSDKFYGMLNLRNGTVWVTYIESLQPKKGNCTLLFKNILKQGYGIIVLNASKNMESIVKKMGFRTAPMKNMWGINSTWFNETILYNGILDRSYIEQNEVKA